jgi:hypothetical protein
MDPSHTSTIEFRDLVVDPEYAMFTGGKFFFLIFLLVSFIAQIAWMVLPCHLTAAERRVFDYLEERF